MWLNCIRSNVDILNDSASILILIQLYEYLHNTQSIHEKDILRILEKSFKMLPEIEVNKIFKNMSEFDQFPSDVKLYDLTSSIFNRLTEGTRKNEVFPEFAWLCLNYPSLMVDRAVMFAVKHSGQTKPISMLLHAVYNVCTMSTESSTLLESTLIKHIDSSFLSEKECENAKMLIKLLMSPQENSSSRGNLLIPLFLMKHFVNHPVGDLNSKILFGIDMFYFIAELNFDYKFESVDLFPFLIRLAFKLNQCLQILTNNKNSVLSYKQKCMKAIEITINLLLKKGDSKSTCYHAWLESYLIQIDWTIHLYIDSKLNGHSYSGVRLDILSFVKACAICDVLTVDNLESKTVPYNELVACLVKVLPYCLLTEWRNIMRIVGELYKHERILLERNDNSGCPMNLSQILYDVLYVSSATQEGTVLVHMVQCYCIITKEFISTQITYGDILYLFIQAIELMKILPESTAESVGVMTIDFLLIIEKQTMAAEQLKRIDEYLCNLKDERFSIILKKWTNICQSLSQSVSN
ncbi:uncharacterized protein LOC141898401 [Tubulanus polymorphus]|uniref:uncharacterized protein LOC141898401 n=1 Tax=Tubulanus polymorphus TaxID=672921 RepID=UPI003DA3A9D3